MIGLIQFLTRRLRDIVAVPICIIAIVHIPSPAMAEGTNCDIELFKAKQSETTSQFTDLFQLQLVDESNYDVAKKSAAAKYKSYFDGNYDSFNEKRKRAFQESQFKYQRQESRNFVSSTVDELGLAAYKACLKSGSPLTVTLEKSLSPKMVSLRVLFQPSFEVKGPNPVEVKYFGGKLFGESEPTSPTSAKLIYPHLGVGEKKFTFERFPDVEFFASVEMTELKLSAPDVGLPVPPKLKKVLQTKGLIAKGNQTISQPKGASVGKSWGPEDTCVKADEGWTIVAGSESIASVPDGPNGPCVTAKRTAANEATVCYTVSLSINDGQTCNAAWTLEAKQSREVEIVE